MLNFRPIPNLLPCIALFAVSNACQTTNPKPGVIPTLRQWTGGTGSLILTKRSRITYPTSQAHELVSLAKVLREDIRAATGLSLGIALGEAPKPGDIELRLDPDIAEINKEGYRLSIGDRVELSAKTETGEFYGTRSLLQMLVLDGRHRSVPKGVAVDWPEYSERGFMLDVGRKFFDIRYLRQYVKFMAWYKLNDFQLHLNDNAAHDYSGFRLDSPKFPGLANKDGAYSRKQIDELQDLAAQYHVSITPEIDAPAHARSFTKYMPELGNPKLPKDHLDLANPKAQQFIDSIWDEFIPWFRTPNMHIGADEYNGGPGSAALYKAYINATAAFIRSKGKNVRMWGGLKTAGNSDGVDRDIVVDIWYPGYHDPIAAVNDGYKIINAHDGYLYIVPFAGYYYQFLNTRGLYESWRPTAFGKEKLAENDPRVLGGMFCVWNDKAAFPFGFEDVHELVKPAMPTLGEILWAGHPKEARPYDGFIADAKSLGDGPDVRIVPPKVTHEPGDLAFGKHGTASESPVGDFGVNTLFDGRAPTRWIASAKKPQWASVDLERVETVSRIVLKWVPDSQASQYKLSTSEDGIAWKTVYQTVDGIGGVESIAIPPTQARFVRLDCLLRPKSSGSFSLFALEVYP